MSPGGHTSRDAFAALPLRLQGRGSSPPDLERELVSIVEVIVKRRRTVIENLWSAASFEHDDTGALAAFEDPPFCHDLHQVKFGAALFALHHCRLFASRSGNMVA